MTGKRILISNVRIFNGTTLTGLQSIGIEGGLIGPPPDEADETVDGHGGVLLPGLIDAHVHLHHEGHLTELARSGVTTAMDMASWPAERMNGLRSKAGMTDIRSAGLPATAPGSLHSCILPLPREALLSGAEDAEQFVQRRIVEGSDYVKVIADIPGPGQDTLSAVTSAAHRHGRMVVAHASSYTPFLMALDAQVDCITHAPKDKAVTGAMVEKMRAGNVFSIPTLIMMQETTKRPPLSALLGLLLKPSVLRAIVSSRRNAEGQPRYENARDSVAAMHRAGIPILAGTDCHEAPNSFATVKHGLSLHQELVLLTEAGLSNLDAIRAATILPAEHFGLLDRGVIKEGKRADLVLLRDDPLKDIRASNSICRVWCAGIEVQGL